MRLSNETIRKVYRSHARRYDLALRLYQLIGLRADAYRSRAIELLRLGPGDCVVDLGCGTGLSFPTLMKKIGPNGRLIGVDLTSEMLTAARNRVDRAGWKNVELVEADILEYGFPEHVAGALSIGAFGYLADSESVIANISRQLTPGGRFVIVDGKRPSGWPLWLFRLFVYLFRPFRLNLDYFAGHPWESVAKVFNESAVEELYGGLMYISSGTVSRE